MNSPSFFQNITSLEELRKQYKALLKQYHPDNGGDPETIKIINVEYDRLFAFLKDSKPEGKETTTEYDTTSDKAIRSVLNAIIHLDVTIEICGTWIWVTGNTYPVKEQLKGVDFKFSKNKKAWYWHSEGYVKHGRKKYSLQDIRLMHGSEEVKTMKQILIGA